MKSEQEIKEYLSTHFFADAIHARGISAADVAIRQAINMICAINARNI